MEAHLAKISRSFMNTNTSNNRFKDAFDSDFILSRPTFTQVMVNLRRWRDRLQATIERVWHSVGCCERASAAGWLTRAVWRLPPGVVGARMGRYATLGAVVRCP